MQLPPVEAARFQALVTCLREETAALPEALYELATPALAELVAGEFSQLAALLPWWLTELVPLPDAQIVALGRAGLYAWWHGQLLDEVIDGARAPAVLPLAQYALTRALAGYARLGLLAGAPWIDLVARLDQSAAAYAEEVRVRPLDPTLVSEARLAAWTPELLMERAAPFGFNVIAHLHLAGLAETDQRHADLPAAVRCLIGARQIGDDASDWLNDLRVGQLNWVSAGLIRDFRRNALVAEGGIERLAGYELRAERYWQYVEQTYTALCQQALRHLAPYGPCCLAELVAAHQEVDRAIFAQQRARRVQLCTLFSLSQVGSEPDAR